LYLSVHMLAMPQDMSAHLDIPNASGVCEEAAWPETPDATPRTWYDFFVPGCVQEMVQRRLKQFEMAKMILRVVCSSKMQGITPMKALMQTVMSEVEVLRVPALREERHGREQIKALRAHIFESVNDLSLNLVDVTQDNAEGTLVSARMICKGTQSKPMFPDLPVNLPVTVGLKVSVALNDNWKPKSVCWNFVPLQPLLDIASCQSIVEKANAAPTSPVSTTAPSSRDSTPTSRDSNQAASEPELMSQSDLELHKARKEADHMNGVCVPCSFHTSRADGCRHGDACPFCHLCTCQEARLRKKQLKKHGARVAAARQWNR
jgi:hypothetical protein